MSDGMPNEIRVRVVMNITASEFHCDNADRRTCDCCREVEHCFSAPLVQAPRRKTTWVRGPGKIVENTVMCIRGSGPGSFELETLGGELCTGANDV